MFKMKMLIIKEDAGNVSKNPKMLDGFMTGGLSELISCRGAGRRYET